MVAMMPENTGTTKTKKELTPQQAANATAKAQLLWDAIVHAFVSFGSTLATWATLLGFHVHIPYLPVWLAQFAALMLTRHVARTWGKGHAAGQLEAQLEAYRGYLAQAQTALKASPGTADEMSKVFEQMANHRNDGRDGPYL